MTELETFAAERRSVLESTDDRLRAAVEESVESRNWEAVVAAASAVWLEVFAENTEADAEGFLEAFRDILASTLALATEDSNPENQVERITAWASTFTVNDATNAANSTLGLSKQWVTMLDDSVRETHRDVHGSEAPLGGTFEIGGFQFHYPGEPVGPPELWINCRCVLRGIEASVTAAVHEGEEPEEAPDEEEPEEDDEDVEDAYTPIPCHGVLAPIGKPTGDGRMFAEDSITHRDLPLPMKWQKAEQPGHDGSVVVATIRNIFVEDGLIHWDGDFVDSPESNEVLALIAEGALRGVSVDLDDTEVVVEDQDGNRWEEAFFEDESKKQMQKITKGRICAATIVPVPAFAEAFIEIGTREETLAAAAECTECGADRSLAASAFAPGTEEGRAGTLSEWTVLSTDAQTPKTSADGAVSTTAVGNATAIHSTKGDSIGRQTSSMTGQTMTSVGNGRGTSTEKATEESPSRLNARLLLTASSTSGESDRSQKDSSSTTFAGTGRASTRDTLSQSPTARTSQEEIEDTGGLELSAKKDSMTSPAQNPGTPGINMEFSDGRVAPVTSMDVENGIVKLSDGTVLESVNKPLTFSNPTTRDGPGWITNPRATTRIRRYWTRGKGAAKIRWGVPGDFSRCRRQLAKYIQNPDWLAGTCANMHKEALGVWPGKHNALEGGTTMSDQGINFVESEDSITASAAGERPAEWFQDPGLEGPTPVTITDDGRIFGHIATWNTCHTGIADKCVMAPKSATNYAYFRTGAVKTDQGEIPVGQITMGIGHAAMNAGARPAAAHYDNTEAVVADVASGEDEHGIWFAGAIRPGVSEERIEALRASSLSGDWRNVGGNMELIAALAVNTPGFPIPRLGLAASGENMSALVACGVVERSETEDVQLPADFAKRVAAEIIIQQDEARRKAAAKDRITAARKSAAIEQLTN